eukprot:5388540-Amphidinium_carterae.1
MVVVFGALRLPSIRRLRCSALRNMSGSRRSCGGSPRIALTPPSNTSSAPLGQLLEKRDGYGIRLLG